MRFGPIDSDGLDDILRVPPLRALISADLPANFALGEVGSPAPTEASPVPPALAAVCDAAPRSKPDVGTDQLLALLYRQLRCLAGPRPDLDDIVQAAAERVLKALPRFEGRAQLSTWIYGVAYRTLLDHDRWYVRFKRRYIFAEDEDLPEPRSRFDSESLLIEVERARRLYQALDQLPATKRAVLILHDLEGLPARENLGQQQLPSTEPRASSALGSGLARSALDPAVPPRPTSARAPSKSRATSAASPRAEADWGVVAEAMASNDYARAERALAELARSDAHETRVNAKLGQAQLASGRGDCAEARRLATSVIESAPTAQTRRRAEQVLTRCTPESGAAPR